MYQGEKEEDEHTSIIWSRTHGRAYARGEVSIILEKKSAEPTVDRLIAGEKRKFYLCKL